MSERALLVILGSTLLASTGGAQAEEVGAPPAVATPGGAPRSPAATGSGGPSGDPTGFAIGQRSVGIAAEIGFSTGLGAALHLGTPRLGLYVAGGILPVFVFGNERTTARSLTFDAYGAAAVNANVYAMVLQPSPRAAVGIAGGYSHNTLLGDGANFGAAIRYDVATKLAFSVFGGVTIYPDAEDQLAAHRYPSNQDPATPQIQGGVNVGLVVYP